MRVSRRASETLLGAVRELVTQSEQVAKAEARVAVSRLGDVAVSGMRRTALLASAALVGSYAIGFVLHAVFLLLLRVMDPWIAALTVAGVLAATSGVLAWIGLSNKTSDAVELQGHRAEMEATE